MVDPDTNSVEQATGLSANPESTGDSELFAATQSAWGQEPRRVLITGGTGFIGWRLAEILNKLGHQVTIIGRNRYRTPWRRLGIRFAEIDLATIEAPDDQRLVDEIQGNDLVYHVAALSQPWGRYEDFEKANIQATQMVADACIATGVQRLIHVSSTAVFFEHRDRSEVSDSEAVTKTPSCHYAATKIASERIVAAAATQGLDTFTVRARAVFGPGDASLLPRILEAADTGRLKQIGDGRNRVDMTYVDNLVYGLILAAVKGAPGGVATITNQEPVELWPTIRHILESSGRQHTLRRVPAGLAKRAASLSQCMFVTKQGLGRIWPGWRERASGEPKLTRYAVGLLAHTQTFSPAASRSELEYEPLVDMDEGLRRTMDHQTLTDESPASEAVTVHIFSTGYTPQPASRIEHLATNSQWKLPATFALIEHPREGLTLFDTGYAMRFFDATKHLPYRGYRWLTKVVTDEDWDAAAVLRRHGVSPQDVRRIIISHFHGDHIAGLRDFPEADYIASRVAWDNVRGRRGVSALKRGFLPQLLPDDFARRLHVIDAFHDPGFGPLPDAHDLFGDGSIRMFPLPGHAHGQMGALLQETGGPQKFLVADAAWTQRTLYDRLPMTWPFRTLAESTKDAVETQGKLMTLHADFPEVELLPTHCPRVAEQYGLVVAAAEV